MFRRSSLAIAVAMTSIGAAATSAASSLTQIIAPMANQAVPLGSYGYRRRGATMAQQKRAAKKARNVKRHRAACRG